MPRLYLRRFAAEQRRKNPPIYLFDEITGSAAGVVMVELVPVVLFSNVYPPVAAGHAG